MITTINLHDTARPKKPQTIAHFQAGESAGFDASQTEGETEVTSTTQFIDSGVVNDVKIFSPRKMPSSVMSSDYNFQDIRTFLSKPMPLVDGTLTTAGSPTVYLQDCTSAVFNPLFPMWHDKLKGIYGFKATMCFTLKVTASRFDQGLYFLAFCPNGGNPVNNPFFNPFYMHSITQVSSLLHARFDINCDSSVTLRVPWVTAQSFMPLVPWTTARAGTPGLIYLYGAVPITSVGGISSADYTIYVHCEDIELFGNTVPQCGVDFFDKKVRFQAGGTTSKKSKKNIIDEEMDSERTISNGLKLATSVATALSPIPILSSIATPMSWLLDAASKAAYAWGFSAPRINDPPHRMTKWSNPYMSNYNKKSTSQTLALSSTNDVGYIDGWSGTDVDEMSISFLAQRSAIFALFYVTTAIADGTLLYGLDINPRNFIRNTVDSGATLRNYTPVAFLASQFSMYRGSLVLKFTMVKTEFHIGRLMFVFVPFANVPIPVMTTLNSSNCLREIVDIRCGNEFEITIPYISSAPYCNISLGEAIGRLNVYLVDKIKVGGGETSDTITFLVEGRGGSDFELAMRQSDEGADNYFTFPATLQSGGSGGMDPCEIATTVIGGGSPTPNKKYDYASACIGEATESILTLLKAGGNVNDVNTAPLVSYKFRLNPYSLLACDITAGVVNKRAYIEPFNTYAPLYALMRGGVRITINQTFIGSTTPRPYLLSSHFTSNNRGFLIESTNALPDAQLGFYSHNSGIIIRDVTDACIIADVPQYTKYASTPVFSEIGIAASMQASTVFETGRKVNLYYNTLTLAGAGYTIEPTIHRAVTDDFRLGMFISIPPVATV
jgi:hypothetical protein